MKLTVKKVIVLGALLVMGIYFGVKGIVAGKTFLAPLAVALLLSMILMPLCNFLERKKFSRGWASFSSVVTALFFIFVLLAVLSYQVKQIADDWPKIEKRIKPQIAGLQDWISDQTGLKPDEQNKILRKKFPDVNGGQDGSSSAAGPKMSAQGDSFSSRSDLLEMVGKGVWGFLSASGYLLLTFIYVFFILQYRRKLRLSFLRFFPQEERQEATSMAIGAVRLSQNYLLGRLFLIFVLAVLYSVGLLISGVQHAILISVLAAFLSLLPYIGNVIGFGLALAMAAFSQDTGVWAFAGVTITFVVSQFVESYILEPYIVGRKVDLNPLATIVVVVLGSMVWGIEGMIISIPAFGILKIVFDHIRVLHPLGYTLGEEDMDFKDESFMDRVIKKIM